MAILYRFLDENDTLLYIGISDNDILTRVKQHTHLPLECYDSVEFIEYCEFDTKCDVELIERYLVSKHKPKFNTVYSNKNITITIPELDDLTYIKMRYNFSGKSDIVNYDRVGIQITSTDNKQTGMRKQLEMKIKCDDFFPVFDWFDLDGKFEIKGTNYFTPSGVRLHDCSNFKITINGEWEIDAFIREMKKVIENYEKSIIDIR